MPTVVDALFEDLRAVLLEVREGAGVIVGLDRDVLDADMLLMILVGDDRRHVELHAVQVELAAAAGNFPLHGRTKIVDVELCDFLRILSGLDVDVPELRDMSCRRVTVFGGTGFLGRRIVRHLQNADFAVRIASRHPDRGRSLFSRDVSGIEPFRADVNDDGSVASAVSGAWAVVNAVSLYVEHEQRTFQSVHVEAARRVAMLARRAGVETLVHISGIGADARSVSPYIRSRGRGRSYSMPFRPPS